MIATYLLKNKKEFDRFKEYKSMAEAHFHGCKISRLRCNNDDEYCSNEIKSICKSEVTLEYFTLYTPELNGVAERMNRTLMERVNTDRIQAAQGSVGRSYIGCHLLDKPQTYRNCFK